MSTFKGFAFHGSLLPILLVTFLITMTVCDNNRSDGLPERGIDAFKAQLHEDMSESALLKTFGEPNRDEGSGIHIYVYEFTDGTSVWIGCSDKIIYARHIDQDGMLIETLI